MQDDAIPLVRKKRIITLRLKMPIEATERSDVPVQEEKKKEMDARGRYSIIAPKTT